MPERSSASGGRRVATRLAAHPAVAWIRCPGLPGDPHHALATRQMRGSGSVLSVEVADAGTADAICAQLRVISHATSLGGVESTIERRAKLPGQEHVPAGLLRITVGCEHVEDLWDDLAATLHAATSDATAAAATVLRDIISGSHP